MHALVIYGQIFAFSVIWSSAFVVGKIAIKVVDPTILLFFRFTVSTIILAPFCMKSILSKFSISVLYRGFLIGLLNNTFYLGLNFSAVKMISPALVIVIISCSPFITVLIKAALGDEPLGSGKVVGMAVGFVGVLTIADGQGAFPGNLLGVLLALAGTISFCIGTIMFSGWANSTSILQTNFYQSMSAATSLALVAFVFRTPLVVPSLGACLIILYLAVVVTIAGMALWLHLIKSIGSVTASSIHLLNPAMGLLLSMIILGTSISPMDVIGFVLIAIGLKIILLKRKQNHEQRYG